MASTGDSVLLDMLSNAMPGITDFLDTHFSQTGDLMAATNILSQIEHERHEMVLEQHALKSSLAHQAARAVEGADTALHMLGQLAARVDGAMGRATSAAAGMQPMVEELASLAEEVARVERVRVYVERLLELERQVADVEDSVAAATAKEGSSTRAILTAVAAFRTAVTALRQTARMHPHWKQLQALAKIRLERSLVILGPVVLNQYRAILAGVGWPPSLAGGVCGGPSHGPPGGRLGSDVRSSAAAPRNPLFNQTAEARVRFEEAFTATSVLQWVEQERGEGEAQPPAARPGVGFMSPGIASEAGGMGGALSLSEASGKSREAGSGTGAWAGAGRQALLWSVEELVVPIARQAERHLDKWLERPEWVFALAYRIARSHVDALEGLLQPLLDGAKLPGLSAREEWVRALVAMAGSHLRGRLLPWLAPQVRAEPALGPASSLWLHAVDQALGFDAQMRSLAVGAAGAPGRVLSGAAPELVGTRIGSTLAVFGERSDWLGLWARLELEDAQQKLHEALEADGAWTAGAARDALEHLGAGLGGVEGSDGRAGTPLAGVSGCEFRPSPGARATIRIMWASVHRCRPLPDADQRLAFVRAVVAPLAREYTEELLKRSQEVEAGTALADTEAMVRVAEWASSARYCEHTLREWGEDVFFLELRQCDWAAGNSAASGAEAAEDGWEGVGAEEIQAAAEGSEGWEASGARQAAAGTQEEGSGPRAWAGTETLKPSLVEDVPALAAVEGTIFDGEIDGFESFRKEWVGRVLGSVLRGFDARCVEYVGSKKRWQEAGSAGSKAQGQAQPSSDRSTSSREESAPEHGEVDTRQPLIGPQLNNQFLEQVEGQEVSVSFLEPLTVLRAQLAALQGAFDVELFSEFWRKLAGALDQRLLEGVVFGGSKFSDHGGRQFAGDMAALFSVFGGYTARPQNFFRGLRDALVLLLLPPSEASALLFMLSMAGVGKHRDVAHSAEVAESNERLAAVVRKRGVKRMAPSQVVEVLTARTGIRKL